MGYLPQQTAVQRDFPATAYEVVESGRLNIRFQFFYGKEDNKCIISLHGKDGYIKITAQMLQELSGGQQRRVMLARALKHEKILKWMNLQQDLTLLHQRKCMN